MTPESPAAAGKPLLLWIGEAGTGTGFARVARSLLARLADRFQVHQLGLNREGRVDSGPWPTYLNRDDALVPVRQVRELVVRLRPEVAVFCYSPKILPHCAPLFDALAPVPTVFYGPVDGTAVDPEAVALLARAARVVAYTGGAADIIRSVADGIRCADPAFRLPPLSVIPHGVDTGVFHPSGGGPGAAGWPPDRRSARARAFPGRPGLRDAFIVLNANRNQRRKRLDLTLEGFAEFARGKPADVFLCLHAGTTDDGWDLRDLARELRVPDRVLFTSDSPGLPEFDDSRLRDIYTACDVGVNTSVAEGWGLVAFEHAATGAAQVVPRHTACETVWAEHAILLRASRPLPTDDPFDEEQVVDPSGLAAALDRLYGDLAERDRLARSAYSLATDPRYSWSEIAGQWVACLEGVVGRG